MLCTYENFILCKLGDLGLLAVCGLYTKQSSEEEVVDFKLRVDVGKVAAKAQHETNQAISTAKSRIDPSSDTCG